MTICKRFTIQGRVQGVWFRGSTKEQATLLDITGYVKNLADGRVEICACGAQVSVEKLHQWLFEGPQMASVTHVDSVVIDCEVFDQFKIM